MKKSVRFLSLLLAMLLVASLLPVTTFAVEPHDKGNNGILDLGSTPTPAPRQDEPEPPHEPDAHAYSRYNWNTAYHWKECACGLRIGMERHVDPTTVDDDTCTCGYVFSDDADLVTLWVNGCPCIKNFDRKKTEYELKTYTYKDVKQIKISTRTHDSQATVELPEDLTLKPGKNTFEVKVTAENQKATKTYTLTIIKE